MTENTLCEKCTGMTVENGVCRNCGASSVVNEEEVVAETPVEEVATEVTE